MLNLTTTAAPSHPLPEIAIAPGERAELFAIFDEPSGVFAVVSIGSGKRMLSVEVADLETFYAFADRVRAEIGVETQPPRRRWRDTVRVATERGAAA